MDLAKKEKCTGCGACIAACNKKAITMHDDSEGFPIPFINKSLCIECGSCVNSCPSIDPPVMKPIQYAYAVQLKDEKILLKSTSGGAFTAFAELILSQNGIVYGCVWDDNYNAIFKGAESKEELSAMRGSKYVWSYAGNVFEEIKEHLLRKRLVLFVGLPCQVAGLKKFLHKDYDSLYAIGLLCGGTPSPYIFKEYLKTISRGSLQKLEFKFRDKTDHGWGVHISYNKNGKKVKQESYENSYFSAYNDKFFHRYCCFDCDYRYIKRVEDIVIGDFWGCEKYHSCYDYKRGVSAVIINTLKGKQIFDAVKNRFQYVETELEYIASENNLSLSVGKKLESLSIPAKRNMLFSVVKTNGWQSVKKYLYTKMRLRLFAVTILPGFLQQLIRFIKRKLRGRNR